MEPLATTSEVIDALGGTAAVATLTGRSMQAVSNWRSRGFFSPGTFKALNDELATRGRRASSALWRTVPASALAQTGAAA